MDTPIYLDTNVIMDLFLERDSTAFKLFKRTLSCEYHIIISDVVIEELVYQRLYIEAENFFRFLAAKSKITVYHFKEEDEGKARGFMQMHRTPHNDTFHYIAAMEAGASLFITKNVKDFVATIIPVRRPDTL